MPELKNCEVHPIEHDQEEPMKHVELSPIHDFAAKLRQPYIFEHLQQYITWQVAMRKRIADHHVLAELARAPDFAPISINLDITTACNYACDHCVDMQILNQKIYHDHDKLMNSLRLMAQKGLKSVIVIGGGEPTLYREFEDAIRTMKALGLQVAIVSNGAGNARIAEIADCLDECDWVRLSLDSATDETFQAMHKPRKRITLDEICEGIPKIKAINARFKLGFSFIITWKGALINDTHIVENLPEIVPAAERARKYLFDYISFKPFLTRAEENNAEIVALRKNQTHFDLIVQKLCDEVAKAKKLETPDFKVYETTNLKVLVNRSADNYMHQPHQCHMQFFRQVLSPLGTFHCPVYRNQAHGKLGPKEAYATEADYNDVRQKTAQLIREFDATEECKKVTCLYNHANWWIEDIIQNPEKLSQLEPSNIPIDYFM